MKGEALHFTKRNQEILRLEAEKTAAIMKEEETDWNKLVKQGKAKLVVTPILNGCRYHYQRI